MASRMPGHTSERDVSNKRGDLKNGVLLLIVGVQAIHALYLELFGCSWLAFCSSSLASAAWTRKLSLFSKSYPLKVSCYKKYRSEEKNTKIRLVIA